MNQKIALMRYKTSTAAEKEHQDSDADAAIPLHAIVDDCSDTSINHWLTDYENSICVPKPLTEHKML